MGTQREGDAMNHTQASRYKLCDMQDQQKCDVTIGGVKRIDPHQESPPQWEGVPIGN